MTLHAGKENAAEPERAMELARVAEDEDTGREEGRRRVLAGRGVDGATLPMDCDPFRRGALSTIDRHLPSPNRSGE